jgi:phage baseplate assembly protein W
MADFRGAERERIFGDDLRLMEQVGGLDLAPGSRGDLALAHGNDNIIQALILRLRVKRGELEAIGWPDYGSRLHELIGEPNIARTHQRVMAYAREALEPDPRVREITDIRAVASERDTVSLYMEILLIDTPNPLNLVYDLNLEAQTP